MLCDARDIVCLSSGSRIEGEGQENMSITSGSSMGIAGAKIFSRNLPPDVDIANPKFEVFEVPIARLTMDQAIAQVMVWAKCEIPQTRVINFANVHMLAESRSSGSLKTALLKADLNLPDGRPISWLGRLMFGSKITQIAGPDFMPRFCEETSNSELRHFFYGGAPGVAAASALELRRRHPNFKVAGSICPPFRALSAEEEMKLCDEINQAEPDIIWICLGCPKQELWAARNRDNLNAKVILAVGQAVDILAGSKRRAPGWTHSLGLEWLYRLVQEPGRLWKRYLVTNSVFLCWVAIDALRGKYSTSAR
jgi:N-acetylglucosaminyldiphosphoundecaprenol N-acetyl-beta-D-mannosaminyltransferase